LKITSSVWSAKEGRLDINMKSIMGMSTGRLDIKRRVELFENDAHSAQDSKQMDTIKTRHPLFEKFMREGPLTPIHHQYWNPKTRGIDPPVGMNLADDSDDYHVLNSYVKMEGTDKTQDPFLTDCKAEEYKNYLIDNISESSTNSQISDQGSVLGEIEVKLPALVNDTSTPGKDFSSKENNTTIAESTSLPDINDNKTHSRIPNSLVRDIIGKNRYDTLADVYYY
jgi:hypothetical protein